MSYGERNSVVDGTAMFAIWQNGRNDRAGGSEPPMTNYVTHEEFKEAMTDIDNRFVRVEARLEQTATKADVESVKSEVHKMDASIKTWMLATVLTIIGTMLAAIFGVAQVMKPTATAAAASPIIIQMPGAATAPPATPPAK